MADQPQPAPPGDWVAETPVPNNGSVDGACYAERMRWWLSRMLTEGTLMRPKMVLFWHDHSGSDRGQRQLPAGHYLYSLQTNDSRAVKRLVKL